MTPFEYEVGVARSLEADGYVTEHRGGAGDYGIDIIATRGAQRLAVQVKRYGGTSRPVNRAMLMELHGASAYAGCTGAMLATDGRLTADAVDVAARLGIGIIRPTVLTPGTKSTLRPRRAPAGESLTFDRIWRDQIMPLQGQTLTRANGDQNTIMRVDSAGIERITSNGRRGRIAIETFRWAIDRILSTGSVTRQEINEEWAQRVSSGVILVLAQVPLFQPVSSPKLGIRLGPDNLSPGRG